MRACSANWSITVIGFPIKLTTHFPASLRVPRQRLSTIPVYRIFGNATTLFHTEEHTAESRRIDCTLPVNDKRLIKKESNGFIVPRKI